MPGATMAHHISVVRVLRFGVAPNPQAIGSNLCFGFDDNIGRFSWGCRPNVPFDEIRLLYGVPVAV